MVDSEVLDRVKGCLLGGAIGDALGYAVEFSSLERIRVKYGADGIADYELDPTSGEAIFSDDTQMSLFTAEGLLSAVKPGEPLDFDAAIRSIHLAYLDWLETQRSRTARTDEGASRLMREPKLFRDRAPGTTCLSALRSGNCGSPEAPINNSKGCGGVMRVAPIGALNANLSDAEVVRLGAAAAAIKHGHSLGYMPAGVAALAVRRLIYAPTGSVVETLRSSCADALALVADDPNVDALKSLLDKALDLAARGGDDAENVAAIGEGWVGEEALAIAIYCAARWENDFSRCVVAAVNCDGDSDSNGAVAGNILGAALGASRIDAKWLEKLELRGLIEEIAGDLANGGRGRDR